MHVQLGWQSDNFTGSSVPLIESLKSKAHLIPDVRKGKNLTHCNKFRFSRILAVNVDQVSGRDKLSGTSTIPSFFRRGFKVVDSAATDRLAVSQGAKLARFANQNHHVREISQGLSKVCAGRAAARVA